MFERYTENSRRVIFFARYEALQWGSETIETEHILLGILREVSDVITSSLTPGSAASLRPEIEAVRPVASPRDPEANLPLSLQSKRALARAAQMADSLRHASITPGHLLLALMREPESLAATLLMQHGADPVAIQQRPQGLATHVA